MYLRIGMVPVQGDKMACSCEKSTRATAAHVGRAARAKPGEKWEAVLPSGQVQTYDLPWQARNAVAMLGGRVRRVTVPIPPDGPSA